MILVKILNVKIKKNHILKKSTILRNKNFYNNHLQKSNFSLSLRAHQRWGLIYMLFL